MGYYRLPHDEGRSSARKWTACTGSCRRLIWLNPLLRFDGFAAKARGIRAMLPHVDEFRPIHSLESMEALCRALGEGGAGANPRYWLAAA